MPRARPVTDDDRELVARLHAEGKGRNEIARELDRPVGTITNIAKSLGLTFDRSATAAATEARQADLAAMRANLAYLLTVDAMHLREQLWQPAIVFNIGGKDNTYTQKTLPEPPADAKRNLMATAGLAIDRSLKLVPPTDDAGADAAKSLVGQLATGLAAAYEAMQPASAEGDGDAP